MKWLYVLLIGCGVFVAASIWATASSGQPDLPSWAGPTSIAIKRVSDIGAEQNQPVLFSNLDCSLMSYRLTNGNAMQTGCFTSTAFGQFNSDDDKIIYSDTDEAIPLLPYSGHEVLAPWPQAGVLLALDPALTGGSYLSLYRNPLGAMQTQRNEVGEVVSKQLIVPPELQLRGPDGRPLVINPQSLAFSDEGSWLVAEDLNGSFVRLNLATLDLLPFAPSYGTNASPALLKSDVAISRDGRYVAINNEAAGAFKVYDLSTCPKQAVTDLSSMNCQSYDYRSYLSQHIAGLRSIRHVRFLNDGLISFEASSTIDSATGLYELAPTASINSLIDYLGMGDSFTSGEGAFDYLSGTDTSTDMCHLSVKSYPLLITNNLYGAASGHSVACSGASINDIGDLSAGYRGQVKDVPSWQQLQSQTDLLNSIMTNYLPGYVAQGRFVQQYQPAVATVSVGGNDIGFGDLLETCVEPKLSLHFSSDDCYDTYEQRLELKNLIDRTVPRWVNLYRTLKKSAPSMRLYAVGYPQIVADGGDCGLNVHLSKIELEFSEEIIDYMNSDIYSAATKAGIPYVDIGQALAGHRLCESSSAAVAVNGLTAGRAAGPFGIDVFGKESYHPNTFGQYLIEQAILKKTNNLSLSVPGAVVTSVGGQLLDQPKSGQTVYNLEPAPNLTDTVTKAGKGTTINLDGSRVGLQPNSNYTVHIDGPNGIQIGVLPSDENGNIGGTVSVPVNTTPGGHTIDVTGAGQAGEPIDATKPIYVPASDDDSDGDGIADKNDSCPFAKNSGIDNDKDDIDDVCDGSITSTGNLSGSNGPTDGQATITSQPNPDDSVSLDNQAPLDVVAQLSLGQSTAGVSQAIGAAALNPEKIAGQYFHTAVLKTEPKPRFPYDRLPLFNWLLWMVLPILTWWLLVLGWTLVRIRVRSKIGTKLTSVRLQ